MSELFTAGIDAVLPSPSLLSHSVAALVQNAAVFPALSEPALRVDRSVCLTRDRSQAAWLRFLQYLPDLF